MLNPNINVQLEDMRKSILADIKSVNADELEKYKTDVETVRKYLSESIRIILDVATAIEDEKWRRKIAGIREQYPDLTLNVNDPVLITPEFIAEFQDDLPPKGELFVVNKCYIDPKLGGQVHWKRDGELMGNERVWSPTVETMIGMRIAWLERQKGVK